MDQQSIYGKYAPGFNLGRSLSGHFVNEWMGYGWQVHVDADAPHRARPRGGPEIIYKVVQYKSIPVQIYQLFLYIKDKLTDLYGN